MNKKEKEILKLEQDIKDTLENELVECQTENKKIRIVDIKFVGQITWKDKINEESLTDNVFLIEKETVEFDSNGNERVIKSQSYYLGNKCIAGVIGDEIIYKESFKNLEQDKMMAVNDLVDRIDEQDIENNLLNNLQRKEISEVLTVSDKNKLSKKQSEKIKVNGVQKADLNKLVDGKETLGQRLDLQEYDSLYVVYSDKVDEIITEPKRNNTTYSLVGMTKDGEAKVLNDEFEIDKTVGNNANREQTKIRANNVATRDNKDVSVYTRKSNGMSIGCENNQGNVEMFLYQKTLEENENVGIQIETSKTPIIKTETRDVLSRNKGIYQKEKVQDEIKKHTEDGCKPDNVKDFDGDMNTLTHEHLLENNLDNYVMEIYNYENDFGEEKIKEVFTQEEIKDKLIKELKENKDKITFEQIVENVKEEMNADAEFFTREHKL